MTEIIAKNSDGGSIRISDADSRGERLLVASGDEGGDVALVLTASMIAVILDHLDPPPAPPVVAIVLAEAA